VLEGELLAFLIFFFVEEIKMEYINASKLSLQHKVCWRNRQQLHQCSTDKKIASMTVNHYPNNKKDSGSNHGIYNEMKQN